MPLRAIIVIAVTLLAAPCLAAAEEAALDAALAARASEAAGVSRVIVTARDGRTAQAAIRDAGGRPGRALRAMNAQVAIVPDLALARLAAHPDVLAVRLDRAVAGTTEPAAGAGGAGWVREELGFDGAGIGVAIIDSGVANWHDDLGAGTVVHFVDFVTDLIVPHDDYGHGTHVAGIIAGNGYDSGGARRGVAPGASLVVLKVLGREGDGHISNVIAAIDYAVEHREQFGIRVINLSVAAGVHESFATDPLTLAARRAVDAGIVVVTAAGNLGVSDDGDVQHGGITSPGNAPWVLTVGASNHRGTAARHDDTIAPFSSRGPTHIDQMTKPDLVAPGVGIASLADASSTLFAGNPQARIRGTVDTLDAPYLSLTGTSMAAPVVAGTVALMLEANPRLTPNLVKAVLQYTAERRPRYGLTTQGAGFLNARGAVHLASSLAGRSVPGTDPTRWSRRIVWGNYVARGGVLTASANAWDLAVTWGDPSAATGDTVVWGTIPRTGEAWAMPEAGTAPGGPDNVADLQAWVASKGSRTP
jgi:subtilisin family serine protease